MKIYTEINYEWLDDQLVQTSSKSFEYSGDITQCGGGGGGGGTVGKVLGNVKKTTSSLIKDPLQEILTAPNAAAKMVEETPAAIFHEAGNIIQKTAGTLGIGEPPPISETAFGQVGSSLNDNVAGGVKGMKKKTNPFLAIDKGKKFARSTSQFRRPSSSIRKNVV
mgnify:CR=1 FL=1